MLTFITGIAPVATRTLFSGRPLCERQQRSQYFAQKPIHPSPIQSPICQQQRGGSTRTRPGKTEKQKTFNFATDIKGKRIWTLRSITDKDMDSVLETLGEGFPKNLLEGMCETTKGNLIVEASLKPSNEREKYRLATTGFVLVDVAKWIVEADRGKNAEDTEDIELEKRAEIIKIHVDPRMGETDSVRSKMVLGAMKVMKEENVKIVGAHVKKEDAGFWNALGFTEKEKDLDPEVLDEQTIQTLSGLKRMEAELLLLSPEPQMKIG